jgi:Ca2+-binding EF-hand superfamily protein
MGFNSSKSNKEANIKDNYDNVESSKYGEFDQLFSKFDLNQNNGLNEVEFKKLLVNYMVIRPEKKEAISEILNQIVIDDQNPLSREEFRQLMHFYLNPGNSCEKLIDVFKIFDKTLSHELKVEEIIHVFTQLGLNLSSDEIIKMFIEADDSNDGSLDFEEFVKIMLSP